MYTNTHLYKDSLLAGSVYTILAPGLHTNKLRPMIEIAIVALDSSVIFQIMYEYVFTITECEVSAKGHYY